MARGSTDMINATLQWVTWTNYGYPVSPSDPSGMQIGALSLTPPDWIGQADIEIPLQKLLYIKLAATVILWWYNEISPGDIGRSFQNSFRQWLGNRDYK